MMLLHVEMQINLLQMHIVQLPIIEYSKVLELM